MPAHAIITALSLHKFIGGKTETKFFSLANLAKLSLIDKFDATPPAITRVFVLFFLSFKNSSMAILVFSYRMSLIVF